MFSHSQILNDRQIRERCLPPLFMKKVLVPQQQDPQYAVYLVPQEEEVPTYQSEAEIQKEMERTKRRELSTIGYRPLTELELLAHRPMIDPFMPQQVREGRKLGTQAHREAMARTHSTPQEAWSEEDRKLLDEVDWTTPDGVLITTEKVISYGLSSFGYDIRCADEFKVFTNINSTIVDPKNFDPQSFVEVSGKGYCVIPPNSFALARTIEYFRIPRDVMTVCLGKSTYARCGIVVNVTPFEPEWEGYVTLEFSNTTPLPAKIYANEGCAQVLFFQGEPCEVSYADRNGKYQKQVGVVPPKL